MNSHNNFNPSTFSFSTNPKPSLGFALRERFAEGYSVRNLFQDISSGLVVALIAIPLGMALAIASGVLPQNGIYTIIFGGLIVALLGGSRFQVTGPTAAFVVILAPIASQYGLSGLLTAGLMAGGILIGMGLAQIGKWIQFIPYPVTTGFTSGIAVVIATLQIKDFFGLPIATMPDSYIEKLRVLMDYLPQFSWIECMVGSSTLLLLILLPKWIKKIPAPFLAIPLVTLIVYIIHYSNPEIAISTLGSRFPNIESLDFSFILPWNRNAQEFRLSFDTIRSLMLPAFSIAMLGAIESLLTAVVADGMTQTKHNPDSELIALGVGNIACAFFGGVAATGAIARTATNVRFGAQSPLASIFHALFTLLIVVFFFKALLIIPIAALSAMLLMVAYNMSELEHFRHILKVAPKSDVMVLLTCFSLTVIFDMVIGVMVGIVLASLLFMKRMETITSTEVLSFSNSPNNADIPNNTLVYNIQGPLFFGAAEKAIKAIQKFGKNNESFVLILTDVPIMDMTGLVALESLITHLSKKKKAVVLVGAQKQPLELMQKSLIIMNHTHHFDTLSEATHFFNIQSK